MLPKPYRLRKDKDFLNVHQNGKRAHGKYFVLSWSPNQAQNARVGIIASKKVGNAVIRKRATRLLRESIRPHLGKLSPKFDLVLIARAGIDKHKQPQVERELLEALTKHDLLQ